MLCNNEPAGTVRLPELLSPAGNMEKLRAAVRFGADAVYLSGKLFGMRAAADNFTMDELRDAIAYAHENGVRVYLTVNVMPHEGDYLALRQYLASLRGICPDALIVADLGVLSVAREILPDVPLHISTQANVLSAAACRAYQALGARRIVLARETSMAEIRAIRENIPPELELEAFVHGSMCMAYSGRCLLSSFLAGRDANRGACTQPCRWHYTLTEEKRPDMPLPLEEHSGETFFLSSMDTCMIRHIPELVSCGVNSLKIEGRMKSAYYTAAVTNAYRMALDACAAGRPYSEDWMTELCSVSHRPYHTGFYFDKPGEYANITENPGYIREKAYLATVLSYNETSGDALMVQKNKFARGDRVELLTPGRTGRAFTVARLENEAHEPIDAVPHPQMKFYMPVPFPVQPGDILRAGE